MGIKTTAPPSIPIPASGRMGALLRVPVDYLLEVYRGGSIITMITLPNSPSTYSQERPSATALTHTLGDVVRELSPNHLTEISLSGMSGYTPRAGNTRSGGVSVLSGRRILEEFDKFLDEYQSLASAHSDDIFMVYRALNEGQAFRVEPMEWRWSEDASTNRFSYRWELHLEAYAGAPADPRGSVFSPITETIKLMQDYISAGAGAISLADNALTNARSEFEVVRSALRSLTRVSDTLSSIASNIDGITSFFTTDLPATYAHLSASYLRAWDDLRELVPEESDETYSGELLNYRALVTLGSSGGDISDLQSASSAPLLEREENRAGVAGDAPRLSRTVLVRANDTLQRIALRAYGDASRWGEIADYNRMRNATHYADGRPLRVGDELSVPFGASSVENDLGLARRGDVYGRDLRISVDGDLVLDDDDLSMIEGASNLEQGLRMRLLSEQGSATYYPEFGLPLVLGASLTARSVAYCASHVDQQLRADPRVDDVRDIIVEDEGDALSVRVDVQPIRGGATQFVIPMRRD